jgi:hypothetical protein
MRIVAGVAGVGSWVAGLLGAGAAGDADAAPRWAQATTAGATSTTEHQPRNPRRLIAPR